MQEEFQVLTAGTGGGEERKVKHEDRRAEADQFSNPHKVQMKLFK